VGDKVKKRQAGRMTTCAVTRLVQKVQRKECSNFEREEFERIGPESLNLVLSIILQEIACTFYYFTTTRKLSELHLLVWPL
jgi:hypothetical protein